MKNSIIQVLNSRLFPKNMGAAAYILTGLASRCDWVIMSDYRYEKEFVHGDLNRQPQTIYLSLRSAFTALVYFHNHILPKIDGPFILITGSEDITLPNQIDARWREFNQEEKSIINNILKDDRLIHWYAENLDEKTDKMSPIPLGYVFTNNESEWIELENIDTSLKDRPLKVFCSHRVREGLQWEPRRNVTQLCENEFSHISSVCNNEIEHDLFKQKVRQHPFTICVQGGGLDPSPKAWMAIANGSIPIIKSSALDAAYRQLPVVIVNDWNKNSLTTSKLCNWIEKLTPYYENKQLRKQVIFRLSIDYWWGQIMQKYTYKYSREKQLKSNNYMAIISDK